MKPFRLLLVTLLASAMAGCSWFGSNVKEDRRTAKQLYDAAIAAQHGGNFGQAAQDLENLQARYPFDPLAKQASLDIIYEYYKDQDTASAVAAADRFIQANPRDPHVDYAYYMRGLAHQSDGNGLLTRVFNLDRALRDPEPLRQAFFDFRTLLEKFPQSKYAGDARKRMKKIRDQLAAHELAIAQYYMKREAYVAAANRAKHIVDTYEGTPQVHAALYILADAYGKLGLKDLRDGVIKVIRLNYPNDKTPLAAN